MSVHFELGLVPQRRRAGVANKMCMHKILFEDICNCFSIMMMIPEGLDGLIILSPGEKSNDYLL